MKIKGERMTPLDVALRKNNGQLAKFLNLYGGKPASKLNKTLTKQSTIRVKTKRCVMFMQYLSKLLWIHIDTLSHGVDMSTKN